jgi:hypothetical protein
VFPGFVIRAIRDIRGFQKARMGLADGTEKKNI